MVKRVGNRLQARFSCPNLADVGVVPFDVPAFSEGLDGHLAYSNSVDAQHAVTVQRLILTDRFLQVTVVQRHVFSSPFGVGDRPHVLLVKLLRLDVEPCFGEVESCLMSANHVIDLRVVRHARDQLHGQSLRIIGQNIERVRNLRHAVREGKFPASGYDALWIREIQGLNQASGTMNE